MHTLSDYKAKCALSSLRFQFFNSNEIEKLSVKEITNPQSIDRLLNPIRNGPYDLALGPLDKNDICLTCGLDYYSCAGHYGHINLVLSVFNPIVFKELVKLLRASCESCHTLLTTKLEKDYFWAQMTINNYGLNHKLDLVHALYRKILNDTDEKLAATISFRADFEKLINEIMASEAPTSRIENCVKNSVKEKIDILREFFDVKLKMNRQICLNCGMPLRQLRAEHHSKLFYAKGASKRQLKKAVPFKSIEEELVASEAEVDDDDELLKKEAEKKLSIENETSQTNEEQLEAVTGQTYLTPTEAKKLVKKLLHNEREIVELLFGIDSESKDRDLLCVFFYDKISVCPSKYRPISQFKDQRFENAQTVQLAKILQENIILKEILVELIKENEKIKGIEEVISDDSKKGLKIKERLQNSWLRLQTLVNTLYDSELDKINTDTPNGVKQLLEKKEGLFRKHMMGKRVNYAGRSVISPDLYIGVDEVGIPEVFAKKLTYPQPVNSINFWEMRQLVLNGPDVYPGASFVQYGNGQILKLKNKDYESRLAIAKQLLTPDSSIDSNLDIKIVHRHLRNGDVLLFNRQPTLHRPSIQAHKARVLPGEKTLRMHYSNCNAYNADFDGDEMNAHLPQNEMSRAEAYNLLLSNEHYLVPKDGKPLGGLIHDHVISGVTLTMRGRFFEKSDYQSLVYNAFGDVHGRVLLLPPTILKPVALWTGKQVISTILYNILPNRRACLNLVGKSKVGEKTWYRTHEGRAPRWSSNDTESDIECMSESYVLIREGNLLCGVLDKAHYGSSSYSLVHCCFELFGGETAGKLLTCFGKVFTTFIQHRGFTLGVEDILLTHEASKPRAKLLKKSKKCGYEVLQKVFQQCDASDHEAIKEAYMKAHLSPDDSYMKEIDLAYKGKVDSIQNQLVNLCFPSGLAKRFPYNNLQLMIQSGAKGSTVNSMQMSCLLGQQELEGRRPRLMPNGNSLPSYIPYDPSPSSGGFICGSFMTGLTPQEYFFHCMAGREGLVDTAVKTSRSGYLQRCLVKHLEGIMVNYDLTVRDSDGSVIQFQYGEDSLSIEKTQFLNDRQFPFLIDNYSIITGNKDEMDKIRSICHYDLVDKTLKKTREWRIKHGRNKRSGAFINFCEHMKQESSEPYESMKFEELVKHFKEEWKKLGKEERKQFNKGKFKQRLPITAEFNADRFLGAISEDLQDKIDKYVFDNFDRFRDSPRYSTKTSLAYSLDTKKFRELIYLKSLKSCISPGDGVGVLAAQSIGEPSTQMTLNTFHFAGRGDMNVTLGIPRLREILMVASSNIKTPSMEIPIYTHMEDHADKLKSLFTRTLLWDCLQDVQITQELVVSTDASKECSWNSTIRFKFLPESEIKAKVNETLKLYEILAYVEAKFIKNLCISINKKYNQISSSSLLHASSVRDKSMKNFRNIRVDDDGGNDGIDDDDAEDAMESGGTDGARLLEKINDELEYVGEDEEKNEVGENNDEAESDVDADDMDKQSQANDNNGGETTDEESDKKEAELKALKKKTKKVDQTRINSVINISSMIESYSYDPENKEWCELSLKLDASKPRLDLYSIIQKEAKSFYIAKIEGIKRCFINKSKVPSENGCLKMITEGININAAIKHSDVLDMSRLYLNDIHKVASTFGIEAANRVIINEIKQVFGAYGINVDYRHLSLIADYMTFEGMYKPFNRIGIKSNASPFQKMSFETCLGFFKDACLMGQREDLQSPSARLVTGRMVHNGTGIFDCVTKII